MKRIIAVFLLLALLFSLLLSLLSGCTGIEPVDSAGPSAGSQSADPDTGAADIAGTDEQMFSQRDLDAQYDAAGAVQLLLSGDSATASSDSVRITDSAVVITEAATYLISGSYNGMLVVDAPEDAKVQLVFNGVCISAATSAALYIREADKVFLTLAEGTENMLTNGGEFVAVDENTVDGALFSVTDLTLNGTGSLTVTSAGGHGIVCKDDLVLTGGVCSVLSAGHGLDANDSVRITAAQLSVDAGKDAIHCENADDGEKGFVYISGGNIKAEAEGDCIFAGAYMQIAGGSFHLLAGGGSENATKTHSGGYGGFMGGGPGGRPGSGNSQSTQEDDSTSMKGLKAAGSMLISGGSITVDSADDALHSDSSVFITGGSFDLASGDDAIHAEDTLSVSAGQIVITESYEGLEALHIDISGGQLRLAADDDGLNAAGGVDASGTQGGRDGMFGGGPMGGMSGNSDGTVVISGGVLYITASGDGIDSNGTLLISGGYTVVTGPMQGDTATLDYDVSATITGGTFIGTGASGMAQTFSDSGQGVVAVRVGNQNAGMNIVLTDSSGEAVLEHAPQLDFAVVILSSPELVKGQTYTITVGAQSGTFEAS